MAGGEDVGGNDGDDEEDEDDEEGDVCPAKWRMSVTCGTSTDFVNGLAVLGELLTLRGDSVGDERQSARFLRGGGRGGERGAKSAASARGGEVALARGLRTGGSLGDVGSEKEVEDLGDVREEGERGGGGGGALCEGGGGG